ncbi:hypothetical protein IC582_012147 [Cucumis melo]|uniref:Uncharacterized protein LOC103483157 n=1 Tax=Cucumis melo TaxID=3656 RepID=A0A1S3AVJ6_CUCME|nr:uncharacterized protein LOC103483157 [Cucumis melo]
MSNLPRFGRTWNRFSSLPRPSTAARQETQPAFTAATEPEVFPSAVPTTNTLQTSPVKQRTSRLSSPVKKFPSPPSSPKYSGATGTISPRKPLSPPSTYNRYDGERRTSATTSPKTFKPTYISPPPSPPKPKHSTAATVVAPLSPLALPRSEVRREPERSIRPRSPPEIEQKKILYQTTTTEKPTKTDYRQTDQYGTSKPQQKQHHQQLQSDVINIKGDNVGAVMHITQSSDGSEILKKKPSVGQSKENEEKTNKSNSNFPGKSFMNSNFQGVNNSILYNSSLSHRDPGLHLAYSSKNPKHGDSIHESRH